MFFSFFAMHFSSANIVCEGQVLKVRHLSAGYPCLSSHSTGPPVFFYCTGGRTICLSERLPPVLHLSVCP